MFGQLTNEEEQCIDNILTTGLDEINDVPSLALSSMSNQTNPGVNNFEDNSQLNISQDNNFKEEKNELNKSSNKTQSKANIIYNNNEITNKMKNENNNILPSLLNLSSSAKGKDNKKINNNNSNEQEILKNNNDINNLIIKKQNKEIIDDNYDIKEIINKSKSITRFSDENILNIINSTGSMSKKPDIELSNSTMKLIDKYLNIDLKSNNNVQENIKNSKSIKTSIDINKSNRANIDENLLLSPSFVNFSNKINNVDTIQKTTDSNNKEEDLLNGDNYLMKINHLINHNKQINNEFMDSEEQNLNIINNKKYQEKLRLMDLSEKDINNKNNENYMNENLANNNIKKQNKNNKYNPKSNALKKLIDKLKQSDNNNNFNINEQKGNNNQTLNDLESSDDENNSQFNNGENKTSSNNSELFTLGNTVPLNIDIYQNQNARDIFTSKINGKTNKIKSKSKSKNRKLNKNNNLKLAMEKVKKDENTININTINTDNISLNNYEFEEINQNNEKMDLMKKEIDSIQNKIKNIKLRLQEQEFSMKENADIFPKKNFTTNNYYPKKEKLSKTKTRSKGNSRFGSPHKFRGTSEHKKNYSSSHKKNYSYKSRFSYHSSLKKPKNIKRFETPLVKRKIRFSGKSSTSRKSNWSQRSKSSQSNRSNRSNSSLKREKIDYKRKYDELREKFELQREKMKSEKQNIISLQQKIKILNNKKDCYPKLYDYNKDLTRQNNELLKNLKESDNIRLEQEKLIRSLQKEIDILKGGLNLNDPETLNYLAQTYQAMKESLLKTSQQNYNTQNNPKKKIKKNNKK